MPSTDQSYANHARFFPLFHFVAFPLLALNALWSIWRVVRMPSADTVLALVVAVALVVLALAARVMALTVQDRVIRLEMRLRLQEVLPADMRGRIKDLTRHQLVGLRFASDAELPDLVRQVLSGTLTDGTAIKKAIKHWQSDHLRA